MDTKGHSGRGGGGGVMNWEIGIDIYILICIKWITNKNLLYKNINKIKFKNSKKRKENRSWRNQALGLQTLLQSYSNQDSMVLAPKQKFRSMAQDRKPRDKPKCIWSP